MPGSSRYLYLEDSPLTTVVMLAFGALSGNNLAQSDPADMFEAEGPMPEVVEADHAIPTPGTMRFRLSRYEQCISPQYDIVEAEILRQDCLNMKKLSGSSRLQTLLACAIAAMVTSYRNPAWRSVAQTCRESVEDVAASVVSMGTPESLTAVLLLLLYEFADPSRGLVWYLMDLAARNVLQLDWHRVGPSSAAQENSSGQATFQERTDHRTKLVTTLADFER